MCARAHSIRVRAKPAHEDQGPWGVSRRIQFEIRQFRVPDTHLVLSRETGGESGVPMVEMNTSPAIFESIGSKFDQYVDDPCAHSATRVRQRECRDPVHYSASLYRRRSAGSLLQYSGVAAGPSGHPGRDRCSSMPGRAVHPAVAPSIWRCSTLPHVALRPPRQVACWPPQCYTPERRRPLLSARTAERGADRIGECGKMARNKTRLDGLAQRRANHACYQLSSPRAVDLSGHRLAATPRKMRLDPQG